MMLHDEHLTQALRHAPDQALSPSAERRAAVLHHARQALAVQKKSLYATLQEWWRSWRIANWQLASAGSVFAAVLVLTVFWHGQPKDSEWVDATPAQIATVEGGADTVAQNVTEYKSDLAIESDPIEDRLQKGGLPEAAPHAKSIPSQTERARSAMPSAPVSEDKKTGDAAPAKEESKTEMAALPAQLHQKRTAIEDGALSERKTIFSAEPGNSSSVVLMEAIAKDGGQAVARRDIEAGVLRHLHLEEAMPLPGKQTCVPLQSETAARFDHVTGYRVEIISGCHSTVDLMKEVEAYNQTLRDWHTKRGK